MNFRRFVAAFRFHSSTKLPLDYEVARLVRAKEDARWKLFDEPACIRKERALAGERVRNLLLRKAS